MARPRDMQAKKLYRSERSFRKRNQKHFLNLRSVLSYTRRILKHKWFQDRWDYVVSVNVIPIRKDSNAHGWYSGGGVVAIQIPVTDWAMNETVVLHEIAHGLTEAQYGRNQKAWHGPEFAKIFASLVQHYMGTDAGRSLKQCFRDNKVKYRSPNGKA